MMDDSALSEERENLLLQKKPELLRNIRLTPMFWASLSKHDVVTIGEIGEIQGTASTTPQTQISTLVDHVMMGTNDRYIGLLEALVEAGQMHIVTHVLKEDIPKTMASGGTSAQGDTASTAGVQQLEASKGTKLKASACASLPPWDRNNITALMSYNESPYQDILNTSRVSLVEHLQDEGIWTHLKSLHVIKPVDEEQLTYNKSRPERVEQLLKFIEVGPVWHFHSLLRAVALTGQSELIPEGGLDKVVYTEGCKSEHSGGGYLKILSKDVLRVIRDHCQSYQTNLMRRHIFDFDGDAGDDILDISSCIINVNPSMKCGSEKKTIPTNEILEKLDDEVPPRVIRLYGDPGDGKTSLMRHIPHLWSIEFPELIENHQSLTSKHPLWTTMVYIEARNITSTVENAIIDALGCKESDTKILMKHIREGERVALWLDAIDELRDLAAIKEVKRYVHQRKLKGGPTVLISARTDICPIDAQDIDRFLVLQGFTEDQGLQYVKQYTKMYRLADHAVNRYVYQYSKELQPVLGNPLRLYIFCGLALRGELKLDGNETFDIPKLFGPLARYLLRRSGSEVTEQQLSDFYRMCLWGILQGVREFSQANLAHFNIASAFHIFLRRSDRRRSEDGELVPYYSLSHEMLYEYFSGCYIQTPTFQTLSTQQNGSFLISICKDKYLRNMQKTVFQLLKQDWQANHKLMQLMIRCILALQERDSTDETHMCGLVRVRGDSDSSLKDRLYSNDQEFSTTEASEVCKQINSAFDKRAQVLKKNAVFGALKENGTIEHVIDCLQVCSAEQRMKLLGNTIFHLLPCRYENMWYLKVRADQWGEVQDDGQSLTIRTCVPTDAAELLTQYMSRHSRRAAIPVSVSIYLSDEDYTLWGTPPDCSWSKEKWGTLFNKLQELPMHHLALNLTTDMISLTGLLRCLLDHAAAPKYTMGIKVSMGKILLPDLVDLLPACHQAGLPLQLYLTTVVVPSNVPWLTVLAKREHLCSLRTAYGKMLFFCGDWWTEDGEVYIY